MDNKPQLQKGANDARVKPAVPKKPVFGAGTLRSTHVRHVVQKLEEKGDERERKDWKKPNGDEEKSEIVAEPEASKQTLEDLKAIDEDLEKLRKQIEERDKIIGALREAAEAKDKKLESLTAEFSKLQTGKKLDLDTSSGRTNSSSPSSPPLCKGGLCWTDNFVIKNYHEPIYAQLLSDHTNLRKIYNNLCNQLEIKNDHLQELKMKDEDEKIKAESQENAINLIMMEQIRILKEREAQLIWEAEELREQNDLMEFRILELEECRKEFLDREAEDEKRQKAGGTKWNERDLEEVSDSGVVSLPTSEDLTSDSELGEAIRNYSPLGAFNCLTAESFQTEVGSGKKSECLQESGIFVDSEVSGEISANGCQPLKRSKSCQTEFFLDKAILEIIDSSYDFLLAKDPELRKNYLNKKSDDLSTEISKLSVIQERIRQKTNTPTFQNPHTIFTCPHSSSVIFYENRLRQLESKIKIYESSGDTKDILLAKRLEKEVELSFKVRELTQKLTALELINKKLEEEKCEFEEAENDTRFQCQRLNTRLQELLDKNTELELELERQKVIMAEERRREKKKGSLHGLISQYEQRNFELEEKEEKTKQRLSMMEAAMPAIVAWNVFRTMQNPDLVKSFSANTTEQCSPLDQNNQVDCLNNEMFQKIEELMDDQKQLRKEYEKVEETSSDREKSMRRKIEELETKSAKDRETLEEMTKSIKSLKRIESSNNGNALRPEEIDLFEELKHMIANEIHLRAEIERLEKKEQAYMQSLEKADEIWAGMEADYKRRLVESEAVNIDLQKRISQLEATQAALEKTLTNQTLPSAKTLEIETELQSKIEELVRENEKLKKEISKSLNEKFDEHKRFLETENSSLKKEVEKMKEVMLKEEERYLLVQKKLELAEEEARREKESGLKLREEFDHKTLDLSASETKLQAQISDLTQQLTVKGKELMGLEVTVSELREEVETLEKRVAELVKAMRSTSSSQQEEGQTQPSEASPFEDKIIQHVVSFNFPTVQGNFEEATEATTTPRYLPFDGKMVDHRQDYNPEILQSLRNKLHSVLSLMFFSFRQEIRFLYSFPNTARKFLIKSSQSSFENIHVRNPNQQPVPIIQDEIFRLSLENTELQQTLEKMEEESRLKSKELAELQKTVTEIRKEQKILEAVYDLKNQKERIKTEEKEVQNDLNPEILTFEQLDNDKIYPKVTHQRQPSSLSLFHFHQIKGDEPRNMCRTRMINDNRHTKNPTQTEDSCCVEGGGNAILPRRNDSEKKNTVGNWRTRKVEMERSMLELKSVVDPTQRRFPSPKTLAKTSSATCSMLFPASAHRPFLRDSQAIDSELSFAPSIKTLRKIGNDGLFLEWDVSHQPHSVTGFEINVNGMLAHRVRSSTRNKALLHPLNLSKKISIEVFATSQSGRSLRGSQATFLDEHCQLQASAPSSTNHINPI